MKIVRAALLLLLAAFFAAAGGSKWLDPAGFAAEIRNYRLLPWTAAAGLALFLPPLEIAIAAALLAPAWRRAAAGLAAFLLALFSAALIAAMARGLDIDCGCFGPGGPSMRPAIALARNGLLFAAALFLLASPPRQTATSPT